MSKQKSDLTTAHSDLAAAKAKRTILTEEETQASRSPEVYAAWRAERDVTIAEIERLEKLIPQLESENVEARNARDRETEIARYREKKQKENPALANDIEKVVGGATQMLTDLMQRVAESALEDQFLNDRLRDEFGPLLSADFIARGRPALARKVLKTQDVELWAHSETGVVAGDQDAVVDHGNGLGTITTLTNHLHRFRKRKFQSVEYHPPEYVQIADPLWLSIKLPFADRPGMAWDLSDGLVTTTAADCIAVLKMRRPSAKPRRPIETDLVPIDDWTADDDRDKRGERIDRFAELGDQLNGASR